MGWDSRENGQMWTSRRSFFEINFLHLFFDLPLISFRAWHVPFQLTTIQTHANSLPAAFPSMLVPSARSLLAKPAFCARPLSQQAALPTTATQQLLLPRVKPVQHPYFLDRNSRGSLPVYTEIRAQGAKHTVLIRNVEGNIRVRFPNHFLHPWYPL